MPQPYPQNKKGKIMQKNDKIFVVEDNPVNLRLLEMLLGDKYNLKTVQSGEEALKGKSGSGFGLSGA